jgi:hypothetical protein
MTTITKEGLEAIGFKRISDEENIYDKELKGCIISAEIKEDKTADISAVDTETMYHAKFAKCDTLEGIYHLIQTIAKYQG